MNFTCLPLHIAQVILSFEMTDFKFFNKKESKSIHMYFGKKNGETGVLYKHLKIECDSIDSQIFLPPIWSTIQIVLDQTSTTLPYIGEMFEKWPIDTKCNITYVISGLCDITPFSRFQNKNLPLGTTHNFTQKYTATKISEKKLGIDYHFKNRIKSMKLCGLIQKPVSVEMRFNCHTIFMDMTPLILDFIRESEHCYDIGRLFVAKLENAPIPYQRSFFQHLIIEFDKQVDNGVCLMIEEYNDLTNSLMTENCNIIDQCLYLKPFNQFEQSNKRFELMDRGLLKHLLLRFVDGGDHLEKIEIEAKRYRWEYEGRYKIHFQCELVDKLKCDSGYYYLIHIPNDKIGNSFIPSQCMYDDIQESYIKKFKFNDKYFASNSSSFGEWNITIFTKNRIEVDCHISSLKYSVVRYISGGYCGEVFVH